MSVRILSNQKNRFSREIVEHIGAVAIVPVIGKSIVMVKTVSSCRKEDHVRASSWNIGEE